MSGSYGISRRWYFSVGSTTTLRGEVLACEQRGESAIFDVAFSVSSQYM